MRLEVTIPAQVCLDVTVSRIVAEAPDGHFGILPHHGDFVTELVTGILVYEMDEGAERFVALHSGTLVKRGVDVLVAAQNAILGDDLEWLRDRVAHEFQQQDDDERAARAALARLEAGMIRRFRDLESFDR